jgi:choline dehydrogenase-like flavoprotein
MSKELKTTYDAIVVGSGISGGWAAMELCKKGLKTLVLERGRDVKHIVDYKTMNKDVWDFKNGGHPTKEETEKDYPVQNRTGYTLREGHRHFFVKDSEHPFKEKSRFDWIRGYHKGGRSLMWGRQVYRWSNLDFEANAKDGIAIDWPIRYEDIKPWYDKVELFIGISGRKEGLPHLPDGQFMKPMDLNCIEQHLREELEDKYDDGRILTIGRVAHITEDLKHNETPQRGKCQYRNRCMRGCPHGAYFSSQSSTLYVAEQTGNMTLRPNSVVQSVIYDDEKGKATGVRVLDAETKEIIEFSAKVIFLNASTIASASIMLNSKSKRFPNGLGNDSGELGHNIMDHHFQIGASGRHEGFEDKYYFGNRPNGVYVPRFVNLNKKTKRDYLRGFGYQGGGSRESWHRGTGIEGIGVDLKKAVQEPGEWHMGLHGFGECLPYHKNFMKLSETEKDQWGMPIIEVDALFRENEDKMRIDMKNEAKEMLERAGFKDVYDWENKESYAVGLGIHEMGTARMGNDPKTSVLNKYNQVHGAENVFVTDGACMTSAGCQNPSITYMALTARAVDHAVKELEKQNL